MTRDEFASLPPMIALGLIYDVASARLREMPLPAVPRPPKYDGRVSRGEKGFTWMSEMTQRDLEWWEKAKRENAAKGDRYAEQNLKSASALAKWIEWRRLFPNEAWSGIRGEDRVTALPPQRDPPLNDWGPRTGAAPKNQDKSGFGSPEDDGRESEEGEYGF